MQALRGSLSNIPNTVSNIIGYLPNPMILGSGHLNEAVSSSPQSSISGDDFSEKSQAIPNSLIKEEWQLVLGQEASVDELELAIEKCKEMVIETDECSTERKWLVRHLVELRLRLKEIQDISTDPECKTNSQTKVVLGHHFVVNNKHITTAKQYCDHCTGIIWSVVQASYICSDCSFCVHHKCVQNVLRICAHVITSERNNPLEDISPEIGLAMQYYKCAECSTALNFKGTWIEARLCDYTGLYFCPTCHWKDTTAIPARIIHNWDFSPRMVSRASLQELNLIYERPCINLEKMNPKLFIYVQNLSVIHKLREDLNHMKQYLSECRVAVNLKLIESNVGTKRHLIQSKSVFSISDLINVENGNLIDFLNKIYHVFDKHIRECDICTGKGYLCEICSNNEVIFPFDDGCVQCQTCLGVFHRACWIRKNMNCTKCIRIGKRRSMQELLRQQDEDGERKEKVVEVDIN